MTTYQQWRITFNGSVSAITDEYPGERWARIAEVCESRGGEALLEERLVTDDLDILQTLADTKGWMTLGKQVVSPWRTSAEMTPRPAILIGG